MVFLVCLLALAAGAPLLHAQAIPKSLIRLCLRNVATGIACYVVGRGGELLIDGTWSAAWAKAKEAVTGEAPADDAEEKPAPSQPAPGITKPLPGLHSPIIEPIAPTELNALSKRLPGSASKNMLSEGFYIYEAPKPAEQPPLSKSARPEPGLPSLVPPKAPDPYFDPEAYRARNADKLRAPPLGAPPSFANRQPSDAQLACQQERERLHGLSIYDMLGKPDFDARFNRRIALVVAPCMNF